MIFLLFFIFCFISCTPIKSTPDESEHKMELTIHEVQTNIDDMRHVLNEFKTELQIIDNKIEKRVASLNDRMDRNNINKVSELIKQLKGIEKQIAEDRLHMDTNDKKLAKLLVYSDEISLIFSQYKKRLKELEGMLIGINRRFDRIEELKSSLKEVVSSLNSGTSYRVKAGDTLGDIAKRYKVSVEKLKAKNGLREDLIMVGQELKIPN